MTELEKIDKILKLIVDCEQPPKRKQTEIVKEIDFNLSTKELIEILDKLTNDKFVIREIQTDEIAHYFSSFEGRLFSKSGGYNSQQRIKKRKGLYNTSMAILTITNIVVIVVLTYLSYKATERANDNKEEVDKLHTKIEILTTANALLADKITNSKK